MQEKKTEIVKTERVDKDAVKREEERVRREREAIAEMAAEPAEDREGE